MKSIALRLVIAAILALLAIAAGAQDFKVSPQERQYNWGKTGSCVHACIVMELRHAGEYDEASDYANTHSGAACEICLPKYLDAAGIKYDLNTSRSITFLENACKSGYGCAVGLKWQNGGHCIYLTHIDPYSIVFIDPNNPRVDSKMTCQEFLHRWYGWAVVVYGDE